MRGQELLTRAALPGDDPAIAEICESEGGSFTPAMGDERLIGKLVGEVVAVARLRFDGHGNLVIGDLVVVKRLRGLQIGRLMVDQIEAEARSRGCLRIVVDARYPGADFFRHIGFEQQGGHLVRNVAKPW